MDVALCKIATIGEAAVIIWFFVFSCNIISPKPQYRLRARPDNQREERLEEKAQGQPEGGRGYHSSAMYTETRVVYKGFFTFGHSANRLRLTSESGRKKGSEENG